MSQSLGSWRIGIVGATGAVGNELLRILSERRVAADRLELFASEESAGKEIAYGTTQLPIRAFDQRRLNQTTLAESQNAAVDCYFLAVDTQIAHEMAPRLIAETSAYVIDNSSAFRNDERIPLVIPEINGDELQASSRLVANPNCSTIIMLTGLNAWREKYGIEELHVATYQAVSGAGMGGMRELQVATQAALADHTFVPTIFPASCAFNVFCHESAIEVESGWSGEEAKMLRESKRIWGKSCPAIWPFCVRVPVLRAHSQAIWVRLSRPASRRQLRLALQNAPGVELLDSPQTQDFPTPVAASNCDTILVGRIRPAEQMKATDKSTGAKLSLDDDLPFVGWSVFVCGDQLRKGAALNAIQIASRLYEVSRTAASVQTNQAAR
jgi:aspartate-semialdehyde dehydrogenase